jgi:hypothetical protein
MALANARQQFIVVRHRPLGLLPKALSLRERVERQKRSVRRRGASHPDAGNVARGRQATTARLEELFIPVGIQEAVTTEMRAANQAAIDNWRGHREHPTNDGNEYVKKSQRSVLLYV